MQNFGIISEHPDHLLESGSPVGVRITCRSPDHLLTSGYLLTFYFLLISKTTGLWASGQAEVETSGSSSQGNWESNIIAKTFGRKL